MNKKGFVLRFVISFILGFLPSFVFIWLFIQYGSPFQNYITFLSNFRASWSAWLSAIVLAFLFYFIFGLIKSRKNPEEKRVYKYIRIIMIILLLSILTLIFIQLYFYTKFILGNDILVKVSVDKDNIFFKENSQENVTFKILVTMNPFCIAECQYEFTDISKDKTIDSGNFKIVSIFSKSLIYPFKRNEFSQDQILNRFEISCKSKKTKFCYTSGEKSERVILITLNNELNQEEKKFKENSKQEIISLEKTLYSSNKNLKESYLNIIAMNKTIITESFSLKSGNLSEKLIELNSSLINLKKLWEVQDFNILKLTLPETKSKINNLNEEAENFNSGVISAILIYNNLVDDLSNLSSSLKEISVNFNESLCAELNNTIINFNKAVSNFNQKSYLIDKEATIENISSEVTDLYKAEKETGYICRNNIDITEENLAKIENVSLSLLIPEISLNEPLSLCCLHGKCEKCCNENCSEKNYPVIFLHGHSIYQSLPADYSLDDFAKIKKKLSYNNYIDAGSLVISQSNEPRGLWGKINTPITVTASYYFDAYKSENGETIVSSKTGNIDTYAIRLKNIIELVKYRTNKNKVIIVAHSMGGLVVRRYIQIFGGENIDKLILITVPNHGIDDKLKSSCSIIGTTSACEDMGKNSILINNLNSIPNENVPIYNLIGIGCYMGNQTGDGIVKNSSQFLNQAVNYYIKGSCNELNFKYLHEEILNPEIYPQTYDIINKTLGLKNQTRV